MHKGEHLYAGKAKSLYRCEDPERLVMHFRDDTSAFDGEKVAKLDRKGAKYNAFIMALLEESGVPTHFDKLPSEDESLVKNWI